MLELQTPEQKSPPLSQQPPLLNLRPSQAPSPHTQTFLEIW